jgi:hypothetical protein
MEKLFAWGHISSMNIVELEITLEDIEPAVTRTLMVLVNTRLDRLHLILQAAMGWTNTHLYLFEADGISWGLPDPDFGSDDQLANESTLLNLLEDTGVRTLRYIYDFGDNWGHSIKVGKVTDPVPGELYPRLTKATGRCPPEDVGGFPGYEEFLAALADTEHPDHDQMKRWCGGAFDPAIPQIDELTFEVLKLAKRWQPRTPRT